MRVSLLSQCRLFRRAADATTNQNTEIRSHFIIPMATLVDFSTIALSASSTRNTKLRTIIIVRVGSVGTTAVAFIEATTIATAVLRVDRIGLEWTPPSRVVDSGHARPGTVLTFLFDGTDAQTRRQWTLEQHPITALWHGYFRRSHQVTHQNILKANHDILVMDCTYKTNKYKMPLLIISGQTALNTTFYVGFAFMSREKIYDYVWVLTQLKTLYTQLQLPDPIVMPTDMKKDLMIAIRTIFPATNHLLCLWHINNNVLVNCKKAFNSKEAWETFFADWKSVIYAVSLQEYERIWIKFNETYNLTHEDCLDYLF